MIEDFSTEFNPLYLHPRGDSGIMGYPVYILNSSILILFEQHMYNINEIIIIIIIKINKREFIKSLL
jgi:hypothetical protein